MASSRTRRIVSLPASVVDQAETLAQTERQSVDVLVSKALRAYAKKRNVKRTTPKGRSRKPTTNGHAGLSLWDAITGPFRDLPASELRKLPRDGALNHDRYIYGRP